MAINDTDLSPIKTFLYNEIMLNGICRLTAEYDLREKVEGPGCLVRAAAPKPAVIIPSRGNLYKSINIYIKL